MRPKNSGSFKPGNKAACGGTRTGRPTNEAKRALRDMLIDGGYREAALATILDAMKQRDRLHGVTMTAIRACEMVLQYTDPPTAKQEHTGELVVRVVYDDPPGE